MKINKLKINGFGNLENKEIEFLSGINLIIGNNEKGKSTILKFIEAMLYGFSKSKAGKDRTDEEKYSPWFSNQFSGKIEYILDNGEKYSIYRDFYTKDFQVLNGEYKDVTSQFGIDKNRGTTCFYEQTNIDYELLFSTSFVEQGKSKLDSKNQSILTQKITNLLSSGNDSLSYKNAIDSLNKKLIQEVGTDRTTGRPINILDEKINFIKKEKQKLSDVLTESTFDKEKIYLEKKLNDENKKLDLLKKVRSYIESFKIEEEKVNLKKEILTKNKENLNNLNNNLKDVSNIEKESFNIFKFFALVILVVLMVCFSLFGSTATVISIFVLVIPYLIFLTKKFIQTKKNTSSQLLHLEKLELQKQELENHINLQNTEIENIQKNLLSTKNGFISYLQTEYSSIISSYDLRNILDLPYDELNKKIDFQENIINDTKFRIHTLDFEKEDFENKVSKLTSYNNDLEKTLNEKQKLLDLQESILIAKDALEIAYQKVKEHITPKIQEDLENCIKEISGGKYSKIFLNEDSGISVELNTGKIIPVELLSIGTIDQMYLSLRLTMISGTISENMPFILDESFAFYDDNRLESMIKYLKSNFPDTQILIFSCSNREANILNKLGINYNLISL